MRVPPGAVYDFGEFRLDAGKQRLLRGGQIVALTPKAVETLRVLIEHRGVLVERDALMNAVWPDVVVEDGNLTVTISMIRKALGDDPNDRRFIETVPRLGYKFVAEVRMAGHPADAAGAPVLAEMAAPEPVEHVAQVQKSRWAPTTLAVGAVLVAAAALAYARPWSTPAASGSAPIRSIVVLPLTSLSGVPDDRALGLGFADALLTSLAGVPDVRVRSTHGVNHETTQPRPPLEIGRALGVDAVLDGTLQRANGVLRVTLRLIRTSDGTQVWFDSFDEAENEIFRLQDRMASETAESLKWNLTADVRHRTGRRNTTNREAYHAYLLGRMHFDKRQADDYDQAIVEFGRAIAVDPAYALAFAGLADVYAFQAGVRRGAARDALYEKSRAMARRALELDEGLAEAHTTLGWVKRLHEWDWAGSEAEFKRALELNPEDVNAHQWYALLLTTLGRRDEAVKEAETARELEPLSSIVLQNYFSVLLYGRDMQDLPALAEQLARLGGTEATITRFRASASARAGDFTKVIALLESHRSQNQGQLLNIEAAELAIAYSRTRQESKARELIDQLERAAKTDPHAAYRLATVHAELGRRDEAIALLQKCLDVHDDRMVWIKVEPRFDSLRDDERFKALLRRMRL